VEGYGADEGIDQHHLFLTTNIVGSKQEFKFESCINQISMSTLAGKKKAHAHTPGANPSRKRLPRFDYPPA